MNQAQQEQLAKLVSHPVARQCRLERYTSLAIGGPAEALVKVDRRQELQPLLAFLDKEKIAWRVIGRGTNLLVRDEGFAGVILVLGDEFKTVDRLPDGQADTVILRVGGGYSLAGLVFSCIEWGLTGLEFACGIPGSFGGAVIMNAGAWGRDMSSIVDGVKLTTAEAELHLLREQLDFSYRSWPGFSAYSGKAVVTEVELRLEKGDPDDIRDTCRILQDRRKKTQLTANANAGSFFKNPPDDSAGRLIDASGLKGTTIGGAMISEHHANFLVNKGGATADDVLNLMKLVQTKVKRDHGVDLEPEVHFI